MIKKIRAAFVLVQNNGRFHLGCRTVSCCTLATCHIRALRSFLLHQETFFSSDHNCGCGTYSFSLNALCKIRIKGDSNREEIVLLTLHSSKNEPNQIS